MALFAPSDLPTMFDATARQGPLAALLGLPTRTPREGVACGWRTTRTGQYREASPVTHVDAADAPMLLYHGDRDEAFARSSNRS